MKDRDIDFMSVILDLFTMQQIAPIDRRYKHWPMFWFSLFCVVAMVSTSSAAAFSKGEAKPVLNWAVFEQAPYFIRKGALKDKGVGDFLLNQYMTALPNFEHEVLYMSNNRYAKALQRENICVPTAWSHKEEAHLSHSRAHTIEPPMGLLALTDTNIPRTKRGTYSLAQIMGTSGLRLIAYKPFTYGEKIAEVIGNFEGLGRILYQVGELLEVNTELLERDRADMALALPGQMADLKARGKGDAFRFYEIEEITNYVRLMSHCSRGKVAQQAMQKINTLLTDTFLEKVLVQYLLWYPNHDGFEGLYRSHIIEGKATPAVGDYFDGNPS